MNTLNSLQFLAALVTGLVAGLLYGYDCSVIGGLGKLSDKEYLSAFQSINRAILNSYFFVSFFGSLIILPLATYLSYKQGTLSTFYFLLGAFLIYLVGVFGVTLLGNVPLNEQLDKQDLISAAPEALQTLRLAFEQRWNNFHHLRTYAALISFVMSLIAVIKK